MLACDIDVSGSGIMLLTAKRGLLILENSDEKDDLLPLILMDVGRLSLLWFEVVLSLNCPAIVFKRFCYEQIAFSNHSLRPEPSESVCDDYMLVSRGVVQACNRVCCRALRGSVETL